MFATISSSGRIRRSVSTRGRAITNDWRMSMARAIVGNCATSGSDQRPMCDQLFRPTTDRTINRVDRSYDQSWRLATDGTINRGGRRPMVRSIVASCDWSYKQSWGATIDRTINRSIVRPIVATYDLSYNQSWHQTTDRTINRSIVRLPIRDHPQLVVRSRKTYLRPLTIWNRRLEVLNMTIDLVTTDFALVITHDLCDQSYVRSTICPRLRKNRS